MFRLLLSIFALFTVVQSHDPIVGQIMVHKYMMDYSFIINPREFVNSIALDTSIIGTEFNQYQINPILIELSQDNVVRRLAALEQKYQTLLETDDLVSQIQQVSDNTCNVTSQLNLSIDLQYCNDRILFFVSKDYIEDTLKEDFIMIKDNLANIKPPTITGITTLKQYLGLCTVINAVSNSIVLIGTAAAHVPMFFQ